MRNLKISSETEDTRDIIRGKKKLAKTKKSKQSSNTETDAQ